MGSMRDQLIKAGLTDKKRERDARHREESRRKKIGREGVEEEKRRRDEEARAREERQRTADRHAERERQQRDALRAEEGKVPGLIRKGQVQASAPFGNRRFYFVTRERRVSFIEVAPASARSLSDGRQAIVETGGAVPGDFCVVDADTARVLHELEPELVLFWNGGSGGGGGGGGAPRRGRG